MLPKVEGKTLWNVEKMVMYCSKPEMKGLFKKEQLVEQSKYGIMRYLSKNSCLLLGTSQFSLISYQLQFPFSS